MAAAPQTGQQRWVHRIGWFILIWTVSVLALAAVATLLRAVMKLGGLTA